VSAAAGFAPMYRRRVALAMKNPIAVVGQLLTPVLWVLVVGPALTHVFSFGEYAGQVDYLTYVSVGQIVFVLPFSAMFAGLVVMQDRDFGILRELLVAPIRRATIPLASIAAVLTVAAAQVATIIGLAAVRGASFDLAPAPLSAALLAAALLTAGTYGLAEFLAYSLRQPQIFGTLIPAIGATPYILCGAIYPLATLSSGARALALVLPWTHAVAVLRFGFMGGGASGLAAIWHLHSEWLMAALSLAVLAVYAAVTVGLAMRAFRRSTLG
jgi:ABC-2 type transport system permease protein